MRRPLDSSGDEPIEFLDELAGDVDHGSDVRAGPSRRSIVIGVGIVAGLLTIGTIATRGRDNRTTPESRRRDPTTAASTPGSAAETATTVTSNPTPSGEVAAPTVPATPASATVGDGSGDEGPSPLPLGIETGVELYLTPSGAPSSIEVYDIDAGTVRSVSLGGDIGWYQSAIPIGERVVVDGGNVVSIDGETLAKFDSPKGFGYGYDDAPVGRIAPGPGDGFWLRTFGASARSTDPLREPSLVLVTPDATPLGPSYSLPRGADLIGSRADGRPVVRASDGVVYTIEPDGTRTLLARNVVGRVEAGRFVERRCDDQQRCEAIVHYEDREVSLGPIERRDTLYRIQPDGPYVARVEGSTLWMHNTDVGTEAVGFLSGLGADGFVGPSLSTVVQFLPRGLGVAVISQRGLWLSNLDGQFIAEIPGATGILGVGPVHSWTSN